MLRQIVVIVLINVLCLTTVRGQEQEVIKPIQRGILLSGNFGELRATHFHAGVDFRTGGVEGLPVICVKDGIVSRVKVSPVGYGKALYIDHPDGTTTVYAHLQDFHPTVAGVVKLMQYEKESFEVDEEMLSWEIGFRQGDTIAVSGNTGSSGGPHLHFEIRDTKSERLINPLHYYKIRDKIAPKVKALYLHSAADDGSVELIGRFATKMIKAGKYVCDDVNVPAGKIGAGIFVEDYMNDSPNRLGIYSLNVIAGGDTLFSMLVDTSSFDQSPYINEIKDFDCYKKRETVYRCFGNYLSHIIGVWNKDNGFISIKEDSVIKVEINVADINGNRSNVAVNIKGVKPLRTNDEVNMIRFDSSYRFEFPGGRLEIDSGTLFNSAKNVIRTENDSVKNRSIYVLSEKDIPLIKNARLYIYGIFTEKSVICEIDGKGRYIPVKTNRNQDGIYGNIRYLNRYTVSEDTIPPSIRYLGVFAGEQIKFTIKDDLSGISKYRGEVNGKWCLFEYDSKNNLLFCNLNEQPFIVGEENIVKIVVEDVVGNKKEVEVKINR